MGIERSEHCPHNLASTIWINNLSSTPLKMTVMSPVQRVVIGNIAFFNELMIVGKGKTQLYMMVILPLSTCTS